ncbi:MULTISPECIES: aspartyl/asparaginyl beta-hydroxylase domain-containing protein [unclassified Nostoc]|uniref:aspartyl/asparaginyl beta-hydroxylase domain-containing protein n=1 Tax=unclassified Nostoc TaxID=2593658 RepID=UPI0025AB0CE1|nr:MULTISPECIES: aspartyl/asparaginyl beta-hydroxylase domain-containing protein [unclassified Nostoc]MDM9583643.1 aspartyl/asparaginyl beta-hydroxylase domain-containing protein [Nostoc sp. GT001]MDZ7945765.1 aspartyl/asparaginyl beta-hydroxylase domain-containing protein [Nostoc sp. EfeVER01]MDZ7994273.1 aspartyl/asparaginyl beta-hydroxylase domain-containing protein [Nostoc sp. EspVER01]
MIVKNSAKITSSLLLLKVFKLGSKFLKLLYPKENIQRIDDAIKTYISFLEKSATDYTQKKSDFLYPGITHKPWYETHDNDVLQLVDDRLKKGFSDIKNEWLAYLSSRQKVVSIYNASEIYSHLKDEDWQGYQLRYKGKFTETGVALFPNTVKILSELEPFLYGNGLVEFLVMKPGVIVPPHIDDMNISLTCHLGITIPENCGLRVASKTQNLTQGGILFFDNSFEHEAWNKSQEERVILLLELYHPELTNFEKALLKLISTS